MGQLPGLRYRTIQRVLAYQQRGPVFQKHSILPQTSGVFRVSISIGTHRDVPHLVSDIF